jgi:hypothetical protein
MRDINKPHSSLSYTQLLNPDFLTSMNNQLFQFMNILIQVQKENMDQLNSVSVEKTQKLIGKIQKDPGVLRRLQQLEVMHKAAQNPQDEPYHSPCNKETELGKRGFSSSGDTVFKKRKMNDEDQSKGTRSDIRSEVTSEPDECIDFEKVPEICSPKDSVSAGSESVKGKTVIYDEEDKENVNVNVNIRSHNVIRT